jgi:hypothetical protein
MPEEWSARPKHVAYIDETNKTLLWLTAVRMSSLMRKLHSEKIHNLNAQPNSNSLTKLRRRGWKEYVTRMGR